MSTGSGTPRDAGHTTGPAIPSIAVIAVHGIGEQTPGRSASALGDLLLRLRYAGGAVRYGSFSTRPIRIPVRPAVVNRPVTDTHPARSRFTEQSDALLANLAQGGGPQKPAYVGAGDGAREPAFSAELAFMRAQLQEYRSDGEPYDTVRLEGVRLSDPADGAAEPTARAHVYEMHWADLSRAGRGPLRIFGEMYQLFFNLANLGRITIDHATAAYGKRGPWPVYARLHAWAVRLLTVFVPIGWLTMLATVLGMLVLGQERALPWLVAAAGGLGASGIVWLVVYRDRELARDGASWAFIPIAGVVTLVGLYWYAQSEEHAAHLYAMALFTWLMVAGASLWGIYRAYDRLRPGVKVAGLTLSGMAFAAHLVHIVLAFRDGSKNALLQRTAQLFEFETAVTVVLWFLLYAVGVTAALTGARARAWLARTAPPDEVARARRVGWTAEATLGLAAASVLTVTFVLWAAVYRAFNQLLPDVPVDALFPFWADESYGVMFGKILQVTAGAGFPLVVIFAAALGLVLVITLLPAVIQELRAPHSADRFEHRAQPSAGDAREDSWVNFAWEDELAERLGSWLTHKMPHVAGGMTLVFLAMFVVQPAVTIVHWTTGSAIPLVGPILQASQETALDIILFLGGAVTATAVGLLALRGRAQRLALGFRPMLDAALDVDNYLREHPRDATPRARIAERYASLLRYVMHWRDARGEPYRAVVFVTHSQGTVITADLLGFLRREQDPELPVGGDAGSVPRLYLFTMGSPLKQLYNWCFPHLYGWVHRAATTWGEPAPDAAAITGETATVLAESSAEIAAVSLPAASPILTVRGTPVEGHIVSDPLISSSPAPDALGVARWVNAYRSGDYVGRALWRADDFPFAHRCAPSQVKESLGGDVSPPVILVSEDADGTRRELCIGRGGHTHYWDRTAASIAIELDLLLGSAAQVARPATAAAPEPRAPGA